MNGVVASGLCLGGVDGREARRTPFVDSIPLLFLHERDRLVEHPIDMPQNIPCRGCGCPRRDR
jgi:hypothetical protein